MLVSILHYGLESSLAIAEKVLCYMEAGEMGILRRLYCDTSRQRAQMWRSKRIECYIRWFGHLSQMSIKDWLGKSCCLYIDGKAVQKLSNRTLGVTTSTAVLALHMVWSQKNWDACWLWRISQLPRSAASATLRKENAGMKCMSVAPATVSNAKYPRIQC